MATTADLMTYQLVHDWSRGPNLGSSSSPSGKTNQLPSPLVAKDSFEVTLDCYERYSDTDPIYCDFPTNAVATLHITFNNVAGAVPLLLSTGTIETIDTKRARLRFIVERDVLLESYAGSNQCRLIFRIQDTTTGDEMRRTAYQILSITSDEGDKTNTPDSTQIEYTPADATLWLSEPDNVSDALDAVVDQIENGWLFKVDGSWKRIYVGSTGVVKVKDNT